MTLEQYLFLRRPDVLWLTGPFDDGSYLWDTSLPNQDEIRSIIENFDPTAARLIPKTISPRQIRLALLAKGVSLSAIDQAIDGLEEPTKSAAKIAWEYALEYYRDDQLVAMFGQMLGFDDAGLDQLWIQASQL